MKKRKEKGVKKEGMKRKTCNKAASAFNFHLHTRARSSS